MAFKAYPLFCGIANDEGSGRVDKLTSGQANAS